MTIKLMSTKWPKSNLRLMWLATSPGFAALENEFVLSAHFFSVAKNGKKIRDTQGRLIEVNRAILAYGGLCSVVAGARWIAAERRLLCQERNTMSSLRIAAGRDEGHTVRLRVEQNKRIEKWSRAGRETARWNDVQCELNIAKTTIGW